MTDVIDLAQERFEREDDNTKVDPVALLRHAADELEKARAKGLTPSKVLVIAVVEDGEGEDARMDIERYRAGVTRYEEGGLLSMASYLFHHKWAEE